VIGLATLEGTATITLLGQHHTTSERRVETRLRPLTVQYVRAFSRWTQTMQLACLLCVAKYEVGVPRRLA